MKPRLGDRFQDPPERTADDSDGDASIAPANAYGTNRSTTNPTIGTLA
jgi:hypothetical protein